MEIYLFLSVCVLCFTGLMIFYKSYIIKLIHLHEYKTIKDSTIQDGKGYYVYTEYHLQCQQCGKIKSKHAK